MQLSELHCSLSPFHRLTSCCTVYEAIMRSAVVVTTLNLAVQVAQQLGFRSRRRPAGYWDNEDNLDREIAQFVAANWTQMEHPQPEENYWYNQVCATLIRPENLQTASSCIPTPSSISTGTLVDLPAGIVVSSRSIGQSS